MLLVGHVTKDGALAGPRVLEHWSTACCSSRASASAPTGRVRAIKNRFGSHQRGRRVRDARRRPGRGAGCLRAVRGRGDPCPGQRGPVRDGGLAAAARRGPGARLPVRAGAAATGRRRTGPQPGRARARSPGPPRRDRAGPPTCSSTSSAAYASTILAPISRSRSRSLARPARPTLTGAGGAADGVLRRARADRRAAHRRPRRPPARRGGRNSVCRGYRA